MIWFVLGYFAGYGLYSFIRDAYQLFKGEEL